MELPPDYASKCRKAYFNLLRFLAEADKNLHSKTPDKQLSPDYCQKVARVLSLYQTVEGLYAELGYRTLMPACGSLPGAKEDAQGNHALCVERRQNELPMFYATRLRNRLERAMLAAGDREVAGAAYQRTLRPEHLSM